MYSNFDTKNIKYVDIDIVKIKNKKNKYMFIPETNISVNHTMVINNVWPRSGCEIKRSTVSYTHLTLPTKRSV